MEDLIWLTAKGGMDFNWDSRKCEMAALFVGKMVDALGPFVAAKEL